MTKRFVPAVLCTALLMLAVGAGVASATSFTPGAPGLGDPMFPNAGNGGYDVQHYDLKLDYTPATKQLTATAVITATATQNLSSFNLDLRGFTISRLLVNGRPATFSRDGGQELTRHARVGLARARASRSRSTTPARRASSPTRTARSRAGCRPTTARSSSTSRRAHPRWFPCNDNPRDKATYDFSVSVPDGPDRDGERRARLERVAAAARRRGSGRRPTRWRRTSRPQRSAVRPDVSKVAGHPVLRRGRPAARRRGRCSRSCPAAVQLLHARSTGRIPFNAVGAIVDTREERRLLARDADEAELPALPDEATARARAVAHVVRRLGDADDVARHLAARRLRDVVRVDLERAQGNKTRGAEVQAAVQHHPPRTRAFWGPPVDDPGRPGASLQRHGLRPWRR